jgi:ribosomal protein S18 acetylase RimI-like enzyme
MWRAATPADDDAIVALCLALFEEDPGQPIDAAQVRRTLAAFRAEPTRGRAVVADVAGERVGYALLAAFWSNEYGGELCTVDELYVVPARRGAGLATALLQAIDHDRALWPARPAALQLEVTPSNARARAFYERLGFEERNRLLRRRR